MTKLEKFEELLNCKMNEIVKAYEEYLGRDHDYYLTLTVMHKNGVLYLSANNEYWRVEDQDHPVNWFTFRKIIKYVHKDALFNILYINDEEEGYLYAGTEEECEQWIKENTNE